MRTQPHKSHVIDDLLDEIDEISVWLDITRSNPLARSDFVTVRKEVLTHIYEILFEARRKLSNETDR